MHFLQDAYPVRRQLLTRPDDIGIFEFRYRVMRYLAKRARFAITEKAWKYELEVDYQDVKTWTQVTAIIKLTGKARDIFNFTFWLENYEP